MSMWQQEYIRNVSIIAHVDHGKTALTESLGHFYTDVDDEKEMGITIKSASVTLTFPRIEMDEKDEESKVEYRINLIDSPGHIDFSSEVTAALRITDGAICVIDCIEGVCVQTETVLRQAILERVKPVLFINKIDRVWLEKKLELHETYKLFKNTIESTNAICHTYKDDTLGDINLDPTKLNVGFGSGYFGYGFTLGTFADMYTSRVNGSIKRTTMIRKLWGNNYFDTETQKWVKSDNDGKINNGFCEYVLKPIQVLHDSIMNNQKDIYEPIIEALQLNITQKQLSKCENEKKVLKLVMSTWLNTKPCVLDLCADNLPSPVEAQKYRIRSLYTGPLDTQEAQDMLTCNPKGTLSMYVSKMIPDVKNPGNFIAFGRVFSGCVKQGQELRILGQSPVDEDDTKQSQREVKKKVQTIYQMMGAKKKPISECPAGNVCGISGIDKYLTKSGTLANSAHTFPFKTMKFSVSPVVNVAVEIVDTKKLDKLVEGLKRLSQYDNIVKIKQNKQGQQIVSGSGELHLRTCLKTLRDVFMAKIPIKTSNPIVSFCEGISGICGSTITLPTQQTKKQRSNWKYPSVVCAKSSNKHNHLYISCQPLSKAVCDAIENNEIKLSGNAQEFGKEFANKFNNWTKEEASRIWSFGCAPYGKPNVLVDETRGVQYLKDIKSSIIEGFKQVTSGSILGDEPLRGVRFNLVDVGGWKIHRDKKHRGPGQIIPAMVKACYASILASTPCLYEPMYVVDVDVPMEAQNGVFNTLNQVRGEFVDMKDKSDLGIPLCRISGYVPILETLKQKDEKGKDKDGFTELLRANTQGKAFPVLKFSHWRRVDGDVLCDGSMSNKFIMDIRKRKGMKLEMPSFHDFNDRL